MKDKRLYGKVAFTAVMIMSFVVIGITLFFNLIQGSTDEGIAIYINGNQSEPYYHISFADMKEYGLVSEDAVGMTAENRYQVTMDDLGDWMGSVTDCLDRSMVNCRVYYFAKYPQDDSICIVDTLNGYQLFTASPW